MGGQLRPRDRGRRVFPNYKISIVEECHVRSLRKLARDQPLRYASRATTSSGAPGYLAGVGPGLYADKIAFPRGARSRSRIGERAFDICRCDICAARRRTRRPAFFATVRHVCGGARLRVHGVRPCGGRTRWRRRGCPRAGNETRRVAMLSARGGDGGRDASPRSPCRRSRSRSAASRRRHSAAGSSRWRGASSLWSVTG